MPASKDACVLHLTYGAKLDPELGTYRQIKPKLDVHRSSEGCGFERIEFTAPKNTIYSTEAIALAECRSEAMRQVLRAWEKRRCEMPRAIHFKEVRHRKTSTKPV
jgi:hypothetical protein